MKRTFVILIVCIASISHYMNAQIIYYDALFLSQTILKDNIITLGVNKDELLKAYSFNIMLDNHSKNYKMDSPNPFFENIEFKVDGNSGKTYSSSKLPGKIDPIDVTTLSKGISLFLIDRARQELNIAFFQKFQNYIAKYPEISILFPNTASTLSNLLAYQYSQMLPVLQEAFYKDVKIIPENLIEVLLLPKYYELIQDTPEFLVILRSIYIIQHSVNYAPPELIDRLPSIAEDYNIHPKLTNLHSTLKLLSILSNSLRVKDGDFKENDKNYWISSKDFNDKILSKPEAFNVFLGLLYQEIKNNNITFNNTPLVDHIENHRNETEWLKVQFSLLIKQVNDINNIAKNLADNSAKGKELTAQDIYALFNTTIDLIDFGSDFIAHFYPDSKIPDIYIELADNVNNLYINTVSQNYALAMNNALFIINSIGEQIIDQEIKWKKQSKKNHRDKKIDKKDVYKGVDTNIFSKNVLPKLTTYGTFIANMADSETPEEVKAAIELAALPAGSSALKKNYQHNLSLNAYIGGNAGNWPQNNSSSLTWNENFRLTAPIGITYTPLSCGKGGALSLFASIIDVGAIVNYQLNSDSTAVDQKIYLSNIFSPGGYIVYGMFANLPIAVGFGGQYGPGLIKMGEEIWNPSWRWNFFLAVDIPVFNLYKGKGKIKRNNN